MTEHHSVASRDNEFTSHDTHTNLRLRFKVKKENDAVSPATSKL